MSIPALRSTLDRLHAIIYVPHDDNEFVTAFHASFEDFVTSAERAKEQTYISISFAHSSFTARCLEIMHSDLHFNVSNSTTSYQPNDSQPFPHVDISPQLRYACLHWAYHLSKVADLATSGLLKDLEDLFIPKFLFWLEALSVMKQVGRASSILTTILSTESLVRPLYEGLRRDIHQNSHRSQGYHPHF